MYQNKEVHMIGGGGDRYDKFRDLSTEILYLVIILIFVIFSTRVFVIGGKFLRHYNYI